MQIKLPLMGSQGNPNNSPPPASKPLRPIHYLGSKLRILDSIIDAIQEVEPRGLPICDLFAGSGTVAAAMANSRDVVTVDVQEYSRVLCSALLLPANINPNNIIAAAKREKEASLRGGLIWAATPLIEYEQECFVSAEKGNLEPLCHLIERGSVITYQKAPQKLDIEISLKKAIEACINRLEKISLASSNQSLVFRHFGGIYFSFKQAVELDLTLELIEGFEKEFRDTLLAATLSTASEIVNTIGKQFAQPLRPRDSNGNPKKNLYKLASRDRFKGTFSELQKFLSIFNCPSKSKRNHMVIRDDCLNYINNSFPEVGVIYADPPYTRDHYSRFYHVLETMCLRDDPPISTNKANGSTHISRGLYREDRFQSPFCIRSQAPKAFEQLFCGVKNLGLPLVLSYSPFSSEKNAHPRVMTIEQVTQLAGKYFSSVQLRSASRVFHSRLNKLSLNKEIAYDAEKIFICKP